MHTLLCFATIFGTTLAIPTGSELCTLAQNMGVSTHTACKPVLSSGLTAAQKTIALDKHNTLRASVTNPTATNMQKMVWDDTLADLAQRWADTCTWAHETSSQDREVFGHYNVGQNLASTNGTFDVATLIQAWFNEVNYFNYNGNNPEFKKIGHYTQLVWAESNRLGCGYSVCGDDKRLVCNYAPAGNVFGFINVPYKSGSPAADCPNTKDADDLCDCGGKYCYSDGDLQINTCSCNCLRDPSANDPNDDCKLVCPNPSEPNWSNNFCAVQQAAGRCTMTRTNSAWCPVTCDTCNLLDGAWD